MFDYEFTGEAFCRRRQSAPLLVVLGVIAFITLLLAFPTRAFVVQLVGLIIPYFLVWLVLRKTKFFARVRDGVNCMSVSCVTAGVALVALLLVGGGWYLHQYHHFPIWDDIGYYSSTLRFNDSLNISVHQAFLALIRSINDSDYNSLLCWVMSLPVRVFPEWTGTVFASFALFAIPTAALLTAFLFDAAYGFDVAVRDRSALLLTSFFLLAISPVMLRPIFTGMLDIPGMMLLIAALIALLDQTIAESRMQPVLCGVVLCAAFMLRRYYAYGVIGIAACALVYWVVVLFGSSRRAGLLKSLLRAACAAVASAVAILLPFPGLVRNSLFGGQAEAYQAYISFGSLSSKILNIFKEIGPFWIALAVLSFTVLVVLCAAKRPVREKWGRAVICALAMVCGAAVALIAFWRIQDLSKQHWYIFYFMLEGAMLLSVLGAIDLVPKRWRAPLPALLFSAAAFGSLNAMSVVPLSYSGGVSSLLGARICAPQRQADYDERQRLVDYLTSRTAGTKPVYFAAASGSVNGSLPLSVGLPEDPYGPFPVVTADVDMRDGFATAFFDCPYVVATDPVQTHLASGERVVETLNSMVNDQDSVIGSHYDLAETFEFDGEVEVRVYERVQDYSASEVEEVSRVFSEMFPDRPDLFEERFDEYLKGMGD